MAGSTSSPVSTQGRSRPIRSLSGSASAGRGALALTGRLADGWVPPALGYSQPGDLVSMNARIDEAAHAAGRDPATIQRIYNVPATITDGPPGGLLHGSVNHWSESLAALTLDTAWTPTCWPIDQARGASVVRRT